ncbi:MAG: phosphodiester glycosidase family protein [Thermovenabulum sp.]|uniref:phosphodiester glycosidase family protein n=1 Tax=Thermovenabulum sp. TaxID=3100335 RepID=UPI003C7DC72B
MTRFKKLISVLTVILLLIAILPSNIYAQESVILYEEKEQSPIAKGVIYEKRTIFTSHGWKKVHILTVDLSSPYIDVISLYNKQNLSERKTLSDLVKGNNAVAGINGDFFTMTNPSSSVGIHIDEGKLISSPSNRSDMAAFALTFDKIPQILNFSFEGKLILKDGTSLPISSVNKIGDPTGRVMLYNTFFGRETYKLPADKSDALYIIVKDNVIENFFYGKSSFIEDGRMVFAVGQDLAAQIYPKISIGDPVTLDLKLVPEISNIKTAVGGGAVLVENGKIPESFSHNISGVHPRTAIGFTKEKNKIIMVVVDGRQEESDGLTQEELAKLLLNLGAYNALNLDGGGSSTMVGRLPGEEVPKVLNSPSDNKERPVINGIGIINKAPKGKIAGLIIETPFFTVAKNSRITLNVKAYDEYYNPVSIDQNRIQWSISKNLGKFNKNTFFAQKEGEVVITAKYENVKTSQNIKILTPVKIIKTSDSSYYGIDKNGTLAYIDPLDINNFNLPVEESSKFEGLDLSTPVYKDNQNKKISDANFALISGFSESKLAEKDYKEAFLKALDIIKKYKTDYIIALDEVNTKGELSKIIPKNYLSNLKSFNQKYQSFSDKDKLFIFLRAEKGGIRTTDYNQWQSFIKDLKGASKYKKVIVFLNSPIEKFTDRQEIALFKKLLSQLTQKNIEVNVILKGEKFYVKKENSIRFISLPPIDTENPAALLFSFEGNSTSYSIIPLLKDIINQTLYIKKGIPTEIKLTGISHYQSKLPINYPYNFDLSLSYNKKYSFDKGNLIFKTQDKGNLILKVNASFIQKTFTVPVIDFSINLNGKDLFSPDSIPYINKKGNGMVPLRLISENLGAKVEWNEKKKEVIIKKGNKILTLKVANKYAEMVGGKVYVPLRYVSENLGVKVTWDDKTKTAVINY